MAKMPVNQSIVVRFENPMRVENYGLSPSGKLQILNEGKAVLPQEAWISEHRSRLDGRDKVIRKTSISPGDLQLGEILALKKYDYLFAIDTTPKLLGAVQSHFGCFAQCRFVETASKGDVICAILGAFEFCDPSDKPENISWALLQRAIKMSPAYNAEMRFGIITDSDLGNHAEFNRGTKPIVDGVFLDQNFTLLYGADKGGGISNKAVALCDRAADDFAKFIKKGDLPVIQEAACPSAPFSRFRRILNSSIEQEGGWFRFV